MKRRALAALTTAVLASVMLGGTALAASVDPVLVDGNPVCSGTGGPSGPSLGFDYGVKVDPPAEGTISVGAGTVTISDIDTSVNPATFTWSSSGVTILAVIVKGGSNANVYYYNPPASTGDSGLHAPNGFSHINFCYDDAQMPGTLKVKKVVDGAPEGFAATFPVTVDCGDAGTFTGDIDYPNTGYRTFIDLPAGAECTVTEGTLPAAPDGYTWGDPSYTGNPATIISDGKVYVTVTNTLNLIPPPEVGSLKITKDIPGVPEGFVGSFGVRASCTGIDPIDATIEFPDPGFITIDDLPAGATCAVIETSRSDPPEGFQWAGPLFAGTAEIVAGQTAEITVTNLLTEQQGTPVLTIAKSNDSDDPTFEGLTVTYKLDYTVSADEPVSGAVIKDVLPVGLTYQVGSATNSAGNAFAFAGYDPATRTLTWTAAADITVNGSVGYKVTVDDGAAGIPQPLTNTACIDSDETEMDCAESDVSVAPPPLVETHRVTGPPTDITAAGESSVSGGSMLLVLLTLVGLVGGILAFGPVPASIRKRKE